MLSDNWGYYNGKEYLSQINAQVSALYNYRQPDSTYVKKPEILEKITYPAGEETSLDMNFIIIQNNTQYHLI